MAPKIERKIPGMQDMVNRVNANANGNGDVLSRKSKRRYSSADLEAMEAGERKQYEEGMSKGFTERKMVRKGLIPEAQEGHRYEYDLSGKIKRDDTGHYEDIPKPRIGPIIDPEAKKQRQKKRTTKKQERQYKRSLSGGKTITQRRKIPDQTF